MLGKKAKKVIHKEERLLKMADSEMSFLIANVLIRDLSKSDLHPADVYVACELIRVSILGGLSDDSMDGLEHRGKDMKNGNQIGN